jgi:K(+)-stimulated pyrophosphate-energized sodium pump
MDMGITTSLLIVSAITGAVGLVYVGILIRSILKASRGTERMSDISDAISLGAQAFIKREYLYLGICVVGIAILMGIFIDYRESITFLCGVATSAIVCWLGMSVSTRSNCRSCNLAVTSFPGAFRIAYSAGTTMGMSVVGVGVLSICIVYAINPDLWLLVSYAFGSSLTALFLRVGGGIFTKSADVGSDLVGKVEAGIPEDDPRNPGVIADAVGDNVGDIGGMGSDLFESYVSAIAAAMFLGYFLGPKYVILPLFLAGIGIICSIIGTFFVRVREAGERSFEKQTQMVRNAMNRGLIISNVLMIVASYFIVKLLVGELSAFWSITAGLLCGLFIGWATFYYTADQYSPVKNIAMSAETGAATVVIEGLGQGMMSTAPPVIACVVAMLVAYYVGGLYGIAVAGVGILGVLGVNLACDCYGPIVDNAAGIAEMCGLEKVVRQRCDALDAVGNTTAAMGKGFAIGGAALTALAWLAAFFEAAKVKVASLTDPAVLAGLFLGGLLIFLFASLTMRAVGRGAHFIVKEIRRQWRDIPGLIEGTVKPDYARCVDMTTRGALRYMIVPALLSIIVPAIVGIFVGIEALGALLAGALVFGLLIALFMANAGGAWDNAKKWIEAGNLEGKGSLAHKSAVVGDTVGDPFKDTSGPSLNILIKIVGKVALVMAPLLLAIWGK